MHSSCSPRIIGKIRMVDWFNSNVKIRARLAPFVNSASINFRNEHSLLYDAVNHSSEQSRATKSGGICADIKRNEIYGDVCDSITRRPSYLHNLSLHRCALRNFIDGLDKGEGGRIECARQFHPGGETMGGGDAADCGQVSACKGLCCVSPVEQIRIWKVQSGG